MSLKSLQRFGKIQKDSEGRNRCEMSLFSAYNCVYVIVKDLNTIYALSTHFLYTFLRL